MHRILNLLFTLFFLFGCATGYQPKDKEYGFLEEQLDVNSFKVSYAGNSSTTAKEASDYILLRNAELTLIEGYKYFIIVDSQDTSKTNIFQTPRGPGGNVDVPGGPGSLKEGPIYTTFKPSASNTIIFMNEEKKGKLVYDAKFVFDSISSKYGIARSPTTYIH